MVRPPASTLRAVAGTGGNSVTGLTLNSDPEHALANHTIAHSAERLRGLNMRGQFSISTSPNFSFLRVCYYLANHD